MRELEIERLAALEGAAQAEISHCQQAVVLRLTFRCVLWIVCVKRSFTDACSGLNKLNIQMLWNEQIKHSYACSGLVVKHSFTDACSGLNKLNI